MCEYFSIMMKKYSKKRKSFTQITFKVLHVYIRYGNVNTGYNRTCMCTNKYVHVCIFKEIQRLEHIQFFVDLIHD